jgi:hypothetical protein
LQTTSGSAGAGDAFPAVARPAPSPKLRGSGFFVCTLVLSRPALNPWAVALLVFSWLVVDLSQAASGPHCHGGAGGKMYRLDWLTIVWGVSTMFLSALLGYVLLQTM